MEVCFCKVWFQKKHINKEIRKKGDQTKHEEKVDCLQGANPVSPQGTRPLGGTLAILFSAFLELFQIFKKQNIYEPNFATPIFFRTFFWVRFAKGVQIFEPVGKKLLGRHALGGDFGGLFL